MSGSENGSNGDSGPGRREVAHRLFATEFDASSLEYADSEEERAPKYVITPTGARVNRLFVVGVLTEVERVNDDVVRARVVDPTGAFVVYAGQYQPDALAFLERSDPPTFVAVTGKANTFQPDDSERVYTSVRPESIAEVDTETRDRWTVRAAEHTLRRIDEFAGALDRDALGEPTSGLALAREEYGTTPAYLSALRETALDAARLVAGEVEEVAAPSIAPGEDDGRAVDLADLQDAETPEPAEGVTAATSEPESSESPPTKSETTAEVTAEAEPDTGGPETTDSGATGTDPDAETSTEPIGMASDTARETTDAAETAPAEPEPEAGEDSDELGDFDVGGSEPSEPDGETSTDVDPSGEDELYEFDPEERAEIESEFDMDFASGNEVEEPGESDIDVSEPQPEDGEEAGTAPSETTEMGSEGVATDPETEATTEPDSSGDDGRSENGEDVDIEDRAMDVMRELADGDGADRGAVIERVASEAGVEPGDVDDAIDSALLSGRCYEPQDDVLKPI